MQTGLRGMPTIALAAILAACGCSAAAAPPRAAKVASDPGSLAGRAVRGIGAEQARALDDFVTNARERLRVPGAAIAVMVDGKVVYERTVGVRRAGAGGPITPRTRFLIGSVTKPMTTFMQATLVDAGTLRWDTPLTTLLPGFAVDDPVLTRELRLWHASCACSGMPRRDFEYLFEFANVTPEQRIASLRTMKPTAKLGTVHQYSNLMVAAGGFAAAHVALPGRSLGDAYDAVMKANVFEPIGMKDTTLDFPTSPGAPPADHEEHATGEAGRAAMPHALGIDGSLREVPLALERSVLPIRPAGGVWSTLRDMERYVLTELARGVTPEGVRVASEANVLERRKLRIRDGADGYGLGIDVGTYEGVPMLAHDGGSLGFGATMFLLPEQAVGIVILTNARSGGGYEALPFNEAVKRRIVEALFAGVTERAASMVDSFAASRRELDAKQTERLLHAGDRAWATAIAGVYVDADLGEVTVTPTEEGAELDAGEWKTALARRTADDGGTKLVLLDPPFAGGELALAGTAERPLLIAELGRTYVFERRAPAPR